MPGRQGEGGEARACSAQAEESTNASALAEARARGFVNIFCRLYLEPEDGLAATLKQSCLNGDLANSGVRSFGWKLLLGVVPAKRIDLSVWSSTLLEHRRAYTQLKRTHIVDPTKDEGDALLNNPLSAVENSAWAQYHKDQDLLEEICKDLERLYPLGCGDQFVSNKDTVEMLKTVLFLWSKQNSEISYRQGMHEVAAPFLYVLMQEALDIRPDLALNEEERTICGFADKNYVEHDLYILFEAVMRELMPLYQVTRNGRTPSDKAPVVHLSTHIQDSLLRRSSPQLYIHLSNLEIAPQLYTLRWLRLLFGREFEIESVLLIWDYLFLYAVDGSELPPHESDPKGLLRALAYFSLALLLRLEPVLVDKEYSQTLQTLMKLPNLGSVAPLVRQAHKLYNQGATNGATCTAETSLLAHERVSTVKAKPVTHSANGNSALGFLDGSTAFVSKNIRGFVATTFKSGGNSEPKASAKGAPNTENSGDTVQTRMGQKLSNLIIELENALCSDAKTELRSVGTIIAEMKCVRDVLLRRIREDDI